MGYATLIVLLAQLPVFFTGGLTGAFLHPLAMSYVLAVIASMRRRAHRHARARAGAVLPAAARVGRSTAPHAAPPRPPPARSPACSARRGRR